MQNYVFRKKRKLEVNMVEEADNFEMVLRLVKFCMLSIARYPCELVRLPKDPGLPTQLGMYLRKNSPFTRHFEYVCMICINLLIELEFKI